MFVPDGEALRAPSTLRPRGRARPAHPRPAAALRPVHRRRRPGRAGRRRLRGLRGPAHGRRGAGGARRPGRAERLDRELPRVPTGPVGSRPHPPGRRAGGSVRRGDAARPRRRVVPRRGGRSGRCCFGDSGELEARALLVATGRLLPAPGGAGSGRRSPAAGVYYGASASDAAQCQDDEVLVVGAANSAGQAALNFARYAKRVRAASFAAARSRTACRSTWWRGSTPRPTSRCGCAARSAGARGDGHLEGVTLPTVTRATRRRSPPTGCSCSSAPRRVRTGWAATSSGMPRGSSSPGRTCWPPPRRHGRRRRPPYALETSVPGVFAAGDVRLDSMKRVASAVGEGAMSVYLVHRYLATM